MCEQAEPKEQGTTNQEQDGQLNDDPVLVAGQEEEEETTEQHAETNAHESTKSVLEGPLRYQSVAGLAGRTVQVLPAEALLTSRTNGARQRTAGHLAAAFGHDLAPSQGPLLLGLMMPFIQLTRFDSTTLKPISGIVPLLLKV